jgi:2-furoyl-CoA dehydrogenase FAD binding subunit
MKPCAFDYVRADTAEQAAALLAAHAPAGDSADQGPRILAGGQSLMAVLNMRLAQPSLLIDISRCAELAIVSVQGGALQVGAAVTQTALQVRTGLATEVPLLSLALPHISHFPIRNRGTVCGSVAHADPSAELPLVLLALNGEVLLRSTRGMRRLPAAQFFTGLLSTAREADELLQAVCFPLARPDQGFGFEEYSVRHGDFAVCAVAAVASASGLRVAVGGVADRPMAQDWPLLQGAALDAALNDLAWQLDPPDDAHVSAATRRHLVRRLGRRAVAQAMAQHKGGTLTSTVNPGA